ncbi:MAG: 1-deoxy-D-xylulose-5-phosphate reductoisomerase [Dehalococcoidia bacterium]|nr:MAG: 1-deoxy-D-xylulose-5-phosphate reductoisomerase [Dehalococcoidia bacterium]
MSDSVRGLAILGSTGSIGRQTLEVIRELRPRFRVVALAAGHNITLLEEQAREFSPQLLWADREADYLHQKTAKGTIRARWTPMEEMATHPDVNIVVVATAGKAGLLPTLNATRAGKAVALANKEVLVMAGHLVVAEARRHDADLRPVDSEHSAIWQCLWGEDRKNIARIILTGSGGAFRDRPLDELERVTPEQALRHPTWQMGHKITVDSATLLNKGLEAIEAHWLFGVPFDKIEVVLHRESIIHSLVEFCDGSIKAQLGMPDMRLPIKCALTYPQRLPTSRPKRLDLGRLGSLAFSQPDLRRFPCLGLALEAGRLGGIFPTVMAAADEVAVDHFLAGHITFLDIAKVIEATLSAHPAVSDPSLEEVLAADTWARQWAEDWLRAKA